MEEANVEWALQLLVLVQYKLECEVNKTASGAYAIKPVNMSTAWQAYGTVAAGDWAQVWCRLWYVHPYDWASGAKRRIMLNATGTEVSGCS